jgi:tetratricopeptide (TPR) repeat protein
MLMVLCCLALLAIPSAQAQDPLVSEGFDHFYNLEYKQAIADFTSETGHHPDDPAAWNHLAQAILYRAMYRSGALESELVTGSNPFLRREKVKVTPDENQQFDDAIAKALSLCETRLQSNPQDPGALYALGVTHGLRANYNFLVRKAWMDALHDATRANRAHKQLMQLEPDNVDARLIPGIYDYVVGSLSWGYRFLGRFAGFRGNRARGIQTLQTVAQDGTLDRLDAQILLAAIYRRERRPDFAIPLVRSLIVQFPRNYLLHFELVQMYGDLGDREKGEAEIARIWKLHRDQAPGFCDLPPEKIDFLEGNFLFWNHELDQARTHLQKAAANADVLDLNTGIMSWMRLGQIDDLQLHHPLALAAYQRAVAMAPASEVARESKSYMANPYRRRNPNSVQRTADSPAETRN